MRESRLFGSEGGAKLSFVPTPILSQRREASLMSAGDADLAAFRRCRTDLQDVVRHLKLAFSFKRASTRH